MTHLPTSPRTRRTGLRHALPTMCLTVCVITVSGTAAADPISPQCWACLQRLASELPAVNPQEDPSYEQGLTPVSVLPALANPGLDRRGIPTLQQVVKSLPTPGRRRRPCIRPGTSCVAAEGESGRSCQVGGSGYEGLGHNCAPLRRRHSRLLFQSHFGEGASRKSVLQMIEIGQKSRETYYDLRRRARRPWRMSRRACILRHRAVASQ